MICSYFCFCFFSNCTHHVTSCRVTLNEEHINIDIWDHWRRLMCGLCCCLKHVFSQRTLSIINTAAVRFYTKRHSQLSPSDSAPKRLKWLSGDLGSLLRTISDFLEGLSDLLRLQTIQKVGPQETLEKCIDQPTDIIFYFYFFSICSEHRPVLASTYTLCSNQLLWLKILLKSNCSPQSELLLRIVGKKDENQADILIC